MSLKYPVTVKVSTSPIECMVTMHDDGSLIEFKFGRSSELIALRDRLNELMPPTLWTDELVEDYESYCWNISSQNRQQQPDTPKEWLNKQLNNL